jgi:hypothetical protein
VASTWAERDPRAAARWVVAAGASTEAVGAVARAWAWDDAAGAEAWAESLADPAARDAAMGALAATLSYESPASAWDLAEGIEDDGTREEQLAQIATEWLAHDPEAAARAIDASDLSETARASLLGDEPSCACAAVDPVG